ncbi:prolipoprotein diacylglyceryl transferase [Balneolaceae bacterium ANBcel3]|nr:prolipoprotein diacylglyceryl transferase [Balneolaceae bacterium ANBcel3]
MPSHSIYESGYFIWDGDPIIVNFGEFSLPVGLSIPGLIVGIILFLASPSLLSRFKGQEDKKEPRKRKKKVEETEGHLTFWQSAGLFAGSMAVGQLLFLIIPSPTIDTIGPVMVRWYSALFTAAFLIGYFIGRKLFKDAGKDVLLADKLLIYIALGTIIGARLGHVIFYDFNYYIQNIHEVLFVWQGGLASHGATVGILLSIWLFMRSEPGIRFFWITDRLTIPVILGGAFIRLGNFFNSEIYGLPTEVPWAVVFLAIPEQPIPRHPTMLYEAVICILIFAALIILYRYYSKNPPEGFLTGFFMITLFSSRFFIEYTKVEQAAFTEGWIFGMGQLLSIPFILFGIWLLYKKNQRSHSL